MSCSSIEPIEQRLKQDQTGQKVLGVVFESNLGMRMCFGDELWFGYTSSKTVSRFIGLVVAQFSPTRIVFIAERHFDASFFGIFWIAPA